MWRESVTQGVHSVDSSVYQLIVYQLYFNIFTVIEYTTKQTILRLQCTICKQL